MKTLTLFCSLLLSTSWAAAQKLEVVKIDRIEQLILDVPNDKLRIINFWATWCGPCVKEMPYFEKVAAERGDVEIILVSVDFLNQKDKVEKFIDRKKLKSRVLLLNETDPNVWIDKVEPSWQGAIPFTLLLNGATGQRKIIDRELEEGQLEEYIKAFLTQN
jgi:thiol-disulfide isomerase/thioredoxin